MQFKKRNVGIKYLENQMKILKPIIDAPRNHKIKLIKTANKKTITAICEAVSNILAGNIPINNEIKSKLKKYRKSLHSLCEKNHSIKKRKEILGQKGGYLGLVLPAIITGISSIISSIIEK